MDYKNPRVEVDVRMLRDAANLIFDHIEEDLKIRSIKITNDRNLFWDINLDELFETQKEAPKLGIGSIQDSAEFLHEMTIDSSKDSNAAPALMLMHVTALMNFICDSVRA